MKNFIKFSLVILLLLALTACKTGTGSGGNKPPVANDPAGTIFSPNLHISVVKADQNDGGFSAEVQILISKLTGKQPTLVVPGAVKADNEIVIGYCEREVAKKAQAELDAMLVDGMDAGWVIYAEGGSLAIVYSGTEAMEFAFEYFKENYLESPTLAYESAHAASDCFSLRSYYRDIEMAEINKKFDTIAAEHGTEIADSIRALYMLYGENTLDWLASLYDPETGGFYYSNSARDTYGFYPDIKSTGDLVILLEYSGIASQDGGLRRALNGDVKSAISAFMSKKQVKSGYFHNIVGSAYATTERLNADLASASTSLGILGTRLTYRNYDTYAALLGGALYITKPETAPKSSEVSTVDGILDDIFGQLIPERYQTTEALHEYLDSLNVLEDTENALTTLVGEWQMITLAQKANDVYAYFEALRNEETGLYGDGNDLAALRKYVTVAQTVVYSGGQITSADKVAGTVITLALSAEDTESITDILLTWYALNLVNGNADENSVAEAQAVIRENATALIAKTAASLAQYQKADGSFSYFKNENLATVYGMSLAVPGVNEGDIPSTAIAVGYIPRLIFMTLNLGNPVQLYLSTDLDTFTDKLLAAEPAVKQDNTDLLISYDFENDTVGAAPAGMQTVLNSPEPGHITVAESEGNKFVEIQSIRGNNYGDSLIVNTSPGMGGNGIVFEADFFVESSNDQYIVQITLGEAYIISFTVKEGYIQIYDRSDYSNPNYSTLFATDIPVGKWFKLRIEYYLEDNATRAKVTIDGKKFRVSDNFYGKLSDGTGLPREASDNVRVYLLHAAETVMRVDNISCHRAEAPFGIFDLPVDEDIPVTPEESEAQ